MSEKSQKQQPEEQTTDVTDPAKVSVEPQPGVAFPPFAHGVQKITFKATSVPTLPVQDIERLSQLNPDYAERAIRLVENEAQFRHDFAKQREQNVFWERILGLVLGTLISIVGFWCGLLAAQLDHPWIASLLIGSSLLGIVSVIVTYSHGDYQTNRGGKSSQTNKPEKN